MRKKIFDHFLLSRKITTDTRNISKGAIFFALQGASFNGNHFARQALDSGCILVVVDEETGIADERIVNVPEVLIALQQLALDYRRTFDIPFLAITGSNGKTTTKELVREVLAKKYRVHATEGNLNNHIGIPLTLLSMPQDTEVAVIEMGANHRGEIASYCLFTEPGFGLITNIGKAHLEGFGGLEGVKKGKKELYDYLHANGGIIFANTELDNIREISQGMKIIPFGLHTGGLILNAIREEPTLVFSLECEEITVAAIGTHLVGAFNLYNIASAIAIGRFFEVPYDKMVTAISEYMPENNRSQLLKTAHNTLIMDAYNANPTSLEHALVSLSKQAAAHKLFIIGDMLELGAEGRSEHIQILRKAVELGLKGFTIGPIFKSLESEFPFVSFNTTPEAKKYLSDHHIGDHLILIKGSRGIAVETVKEFL